MDDRGQVHAFSDANATWTCLKPLPAKDLMDKYNDRLAAEGGLTHLKIQADREGWVHSYTDAHSTWIFETPIQVIHLIEKYKDVLANVSMELKVKKAPVPKRSRDRFPNKRWPIT